VAVAAGGSVPSGLTKRTKSVGRIHPDTGPGLQSTKPPLQRGQGSKYPPAKPGALEHWTLKAGSVIIRPLCHPQPPKRFCVRNFRHPRRCTEAHMATGSHHSRSRLAPTPPSWPDGGRKTRSGRLRAVLAPLRPLPARPSVISHVISHLRTAG
jgi:hypothetical protein